MDATVGGEAQLFYGGLSSSDLRILGKRTLEWDLNAWKWDGDLFLARSLNPNSLNPQSRQFFPLETATTMPGAPSNCSSSSCSDELVSMAVDQGKDKRELDKRRRLAIAENDNLEQEPANLALNLGGRGSYPSKKEVEVLDGTTAGKKTKVVGTNSNRAICQVEDCGVDLSKAKDYHRRHKVCEMHSKASKAIVGNVLQRFCQQCSRFHSLQEFDEGKRSCRRRLAGHNKRRRKTQADPAANGTSLNDNQASGYLLMSILKILSNLHSSKTDRAGDQDLLSHLLRGLITPNTPNGEKIMPELLQERQNFLNSEQELVTTLPSDGSQGKPISEQQNCTTSVTVMPRKVFHTQDTRVEDSEAASSEEVGVTCHVQSSAFAYEESKPNSAGRSKISNFDLNDAYVDSDDGIEDLERSPPPVNLGTGNLEYPSWMQHDQSSPQTSGNSDSASAQSPSSSGDIQGRTDRIVFKLFGKEPNNFPFGIRGQILDWLSHSPTDIESYIRPGCIILTIYLCMVESAWDELCCNLTSSLSKLLNASDNSSFWTSGWIYVRVQNQIAFISNGHVVAETSLPFNSSNNSLILSVKPIAVSQSEKAQFTVKGLNLSRSSTRLLCALEGKYLEQDPDELGKNVDNLDGHDELQYLRFSCSVPGHIGRGFLEVEDIGLSSSFFPFIVAEKDLCSEIRMLESEIELTEKDFLQRKDGKSESRSLALDFVHEMGWLLHRSELSSRLGQLDHDSCLFPFKRFKWLIQFSADHGWCAVVKKLLDFLLDGTISAGEQPFLKSALLDMGLLHRAVRKNSKPLVELLLRYAPEKIAEELSSEYLSLAADNNFLFRPDAVGPGGLTPLHVAAGRDGSEDVLDALTDDPGEVAIDAWRNARDSTGFTPEDYARLRGHYSNIHLVQRKIHKKVSSTKHVVIDVPSAAFSSCGRNQKQDCSGVPISSFEIAGSGVVLLKENCGHCDKKLVYGSSRSRKNSLLYRPAMLSMVAIAAVCVCVALLFKSSPEVFDVFRPFRWEMLDYGSI